MRPEAHSNHTQNAQETNCENGTQFLKKTRKQPEPKGPSQKTSGSPHLSPPKKDAICQNNRLSTVFF